MFCPPQLLTFANTWAGNEHGVNSECSAPMQSPPDAALAASPLRLLDDDTFRTMCASLLPPMFIPSASFQGARPGYTFKLSHGLLGYHVDHVSSSLVTWLTSASVLDELYRLKGKFMRTSSPSESLEWDRYVVLHAPHERQELADMCLHSLAAIVLRVFKDLPSVAI